LDYRHDLLVWTVVVLLRQQADIADLTGTFQRQFPNEAPVHCLRYQVVRL